MQVSGLAPVLNIRPMKAPEAISPNVGHDKKPFLDAVFHFYYAFGETRLSTGNMFTDRLFTGQRWIADLGIYHFNARFYSPKLGRFLSADTMMSGLANPRNLNPFSYAANNPLRYTDPTGHMICEVCPGEGGDFPNGYGYYPPPSTSTPTPTNTPTSTPTSTSTPSDNGSSDSDSDWEEQVYQNLYNMGGPEGVQAVDYITQNDVHLIFNQETQPAAWHLLSNNIFLNSNQYNLKSDPADPFMLSSVAHETVHLQQPLLQRIRIAGETEAWQFGFTVYKTITGHYPGDQIAATNMMSLDAENMSSSDLQNARQWMTDFDPGYRSDLLLPWAEDSDALKLFSALLPYIPPIVPIP